VRSHQVEVEHESQIRSMNKFHEESIHIIKSEWKKALTELSEVNEQLIATKSKLDNVVNIEVAELRNELASVQFKLEYYKKICPQPEIKDSSKVVDLDKIKVLTDLNEKILSELTTANSKILILQNDLEKVSNEKSDAEASKSEYLERIDQYETSLRNSSKDIGMCFKTYFFVYLDNVFFIASLSLEIQRLKVSLLDMEKLKDVSKIADTKTHINLISDILKRFDMFYGYQKSMVLSMDRSLVEASTEKSKLLMSPPSSGSFKVNDQRLLLTSKRHQQVVDLRSEIDEKDKKIKSLVENVRILETKLSSQTDTWKAAESKLSMKIGQQERELGTLKATLSCRKAEINQLTSSNDRALKELSDINIHHKLDKENFEASMKSLKSSLESARRDLEEEKRATFNLEKEKNDLAQSNSKLSKTLLSLESKMNDFKSTTASLEEALSSKTLEIKNSHNEIALKNEEILSIKRQLVEFMAKSSDSDTISRQRLLEFQNQVAEKEAKWMAERDRLQKTLLDFSAKGDFEVVAANEIQNLQQERNQLESNMKRMDDHFKIKLFEMEQMLVKASENAQREYSIQEEEKLKYHMDIDRLKSEICKMENTIRHLEQRLHESHSSINEMQDALNECEDVMNGSEDRIHDLNMSLREMEMKYNDSEIRYEAVVMEMNDLEDAHRQALNHFNFKMSSVISELNQVRAERDELEYSFSLLKEKLDHLQLEQEYREENSKINEQEVNSILFLVML
jgi:chromosome segregation ATPase